MNPIYIKKVIYIGFISRRVGLDQQFKTNKCNLPLIQTEGQIPDVNLIRCRKAFDKINTPFLIKVLERLGMQGTYLQMKDTICSKPLSHTKLNQEIFKAFPLK